MRLLAALLMAWVCLPAIGRAVRLNAQLRAGGSYNSNVNNSAVSEQSDISGILAGSLSLESERNVPFTWRLSYAGVYNAFLDRSDRDGYNQTFGGEFRTPLNPATSLAGGFDIVQTFDTGGIETTDTQLNATRRNDRIDRGRFNIGLGHRLGPRWSSSFGLNYRATRYNSRTRADFEAMGGVASLTHALSARQSLGGGLSFTRQRIEGTRVSSEQVTDFANAFVSWNYLMSPRWSIASRIGPAFIKADDRDDPIVLLEQPTLLIPVVNVNGVPRPIDATSCPTVSALSPPGGIGRFLDGSCQPILDAPPITNNPIVDTLFLTNQGDFETTADSLTTFANISLVRRGDLNSWTISLNRTDGGNLGGLTSTVATTVVSSFRWQPAEKWDLTFTGVYSNRESATDSTPVVGVFVPLGDIDPNTNVPNAAVRSLCTPSTCPGAPDGSAERRVVKLDNAVDIDTWSLRLQATRRITRKLRGQIDLTYVDQENNSQALNSVSSFDAWRVNFYLIYQFDPIAL